jgi:hypothetical protein
MVLNRPRSVLLLVASLLTALTLGLALACSDDDGGDNGASAPTGTVEVPVDGGTPVDGSGTPSTVDENLPAVQAARQHLLDNVDLDPATLSVTSVTATTFSDSCLDVQEITEPDEVCAQVITPGYIILLQAGSTTYTYHTDESGSNVRFAGVDIGN